MKRPGGGGFRSPSLWVGLWLLSLAAVVIWTRSYTDAENAGPAVFESEAAVDTLSEVKSLRLEVNKLQQQLLNANNKLDVITEQQTEARAAPTNSLVAPEVVFKDKPCPDPALAATIKTKGKQICYDGPEVCKGRSSAKNFYQCNNRGKAYETVDEAGNGVCWCKDCNGGSSGRNCELGPCNGKDRDSWCNGRGDPYELVFHQPKHHVDDDGLCKCRRCLEGYSGDRCETDNYFREGKCHAMDKIDEPEIPAMGLEAEELCRAACYEAGEECGAFSYDIAEASCTLRRGELGGHHACRVRVDPCAGKTREGWCYGRADPTPGGYVCKCPGCSDGYSGSRCELGYCLGPEMCAGLGTRDACATDAACVWRSGPDQQETGLWKVRWPKRDQGGQFAAIYNHQHPSDCSKAKFLVAYMPTIGNTEDSRNIGAIATMTARWLAVGMETGRVVINRGTYQLGDCPDADLTCYFEPMSNCRFEDIPKEDQDGGYYLNDVSKTVPPEYRVVYCPQAWSKRPDMLQIYQHAAKTTHGLDDKVYAGLLTYFFAPNAETTAVLEENMKLSIPSWLDPERTIALPIRASDKCHGHHVVGSAPGEWECFMFEDYIAAAERVKEFDPLVDTIILTSESPAVVEEAKAFNAKYGTDWRWVFNEGDLMQGTGSANAMTNDNDGKHRKMTVFEIIHSALTSMHLQMRSRYVVGIRDKSNWIEIINIFAQSSELSFSFNDKWRVYPARGEGLKYFDVKSAGDSE